MNWGNPAWLQLLWLVPVLAFFLWWSRRRNRRIQDRLLSPLMSGRLVHQVSLRRRRIALWLFFLAIVTLAMALARPQWGTRMENITRRGVDVILAVDTSLSMDSTDITPSRLERAKYLMKNLIDRLGENRVGVVSFAGSAYLQCPLTLDHSAARMFLELMDTHAVATPGTDLGEAIRTAAAAFPRQEKKFKVLVLLTDGEDHEGSIEAAVEEAKQSGLIIHCLGIGTPAGQPIPMRDEQGNTGGYKKDAQGNVVVSRLDENALQRIAEASGGKYYFAGADMAGLSGLFDEIGGMDKKELESRMVRNYEDRFPWFLALALLLLAAETMIRTFHGW